MAKIWIISLIILQGVFSASNSFSQKLVIRMNSGIEHQDELDLIRKLYFSGGYLVVDFYAGMDDSYGLTEVQKLYFDSTVSVDENPLKSDSGVRVYPNPAGDEITVYGIPGEGVVSVFAADGRLVLQGVSTGEITRLDVSGLPRGLYLVNASGLTTKFVKR